MDASEVWELFFLDIQKPHCKNFWWNHNKNESCKAYLGNKEQKLLFLGVSQSDAYIEFDFACPFFTVPDRARNFIYQTRISKFVQPCLLLLCAWVYQQTLRKSFRIWTCIWKEVLYPELQVCLSGRIFCINAWSFLIFFWIIQEKFQIPHCYCSISKIVLRSISK